MQAKTDNVFHFMHAEMKFEARFMAINRVHCNMKHWTAGCMGGQVSSYNAHNIISE